MDFMEGIIMLKYKNIKKIEKLDFSDYCQIDKFSHSTLKNNPDFEFKETERMRIGKVVDALLMKDYEEFYFNYELSDTEKIGRKIAISIRDMFADLYKHFVPQLSYQADIYLDELVLPIKGRPDWILPEYAVIDLKVTFDAKNESDCLKIIEYMSYDNQLYNYGKLAKVDKHYILIHCAKVGKTFVFKRNVINSENWWVNKVLEHGKIVTQL